MQDSEELLNGDWELNGGVLDEPDPPGSHHIPPAYVDIDQHRDFYPSAAHVYRKGHTFMDIFDADQYAEKRNGNLFYPFASKQDWEIASWLLRLGLSMAAIDQFLRLELVSCTPH